MIPPSPDAPADIAARFRLQAIAGTGGMGVVHRALDLHSGQLCAVKIMRQDDPSATARFLREAEVLQRLDHPGIVQHLAHGATETGSPFLAMEWLDGEDLACRLERGPLQVPEVLTLAAQVADALAFAHGQRIVHRDLKPSNVFLLRGDTARPRLVDFGIARWTEGQDAATRTGSVVGTPAYMAPEQARGERGVDGRADLFSLGCLVFECLTGRPPFLGDHGIAVLIKVLVEEPPRVRSLRPDVPAALDDLVARLLAKSPTERPPGAQQVAEELRSLQLGEGAPLRAKRPTALTGLERRVLSLVVVADPWPGQRGAVVGLRTATTQRDEPEEAPTLLLEESWSESETVRLLGGGTLLELQRHLRQEGTTLARLVDGTLVATIAGGPQALRGGGTADLTAPSHHKSAEGAARCALWLRHQLPAVPMVVATGYGLAVDGMPAGGAGIGEAIERAAGQLRAMPRDLAEIVLDDATVGLLGGRYDIAQVARAETTAGFAWRLLGGKSAETQPNLLLGRQTTLVGRQRELRMLLATFDGTVADATSSAVLVSGAAGLGKTRLAQGFVAELRARGTPVQVWRARADALAQGSPHGLLADLVAHVAGLQSGTPVQERVERLRLRLGRHLAPVAAEHALAFLAATLGLPGPTPPALQAARHDPALMADHVQAATVAWLRAEAEAEPLVLLLDDLQWCDSATLRLLATALAALPDRPVLMVGLARTEIHERFEQLRKDQAVQEIRLGELPPQAARSLVREVLPHLPDEAVEHLVTRAGGQAFFLEELIRATALGQGEALPATVAAVAQSRIEALPSEARRALRAASVFGQRAWADGVRALMGAGPDADVRPWLHALTAAELLAPVARPTLAGQSEFVFQQAILQEAAYAMLTDEDRALGHRLAADWLEAAGTTDPTVLAEHLERGGEPERAQEHRARAADEALTRNDFEAALHNVRQGLQVDGGTARGRLELVLAEVLLWQGHTAEALQHAEVAAAAFPPGSVTFYRAHAELARARIRSGSLQELDAGIDLFLQAPPVPGAEEAAVYGAARFAVNLMFAGAVASADRLLAFAERLAAVHPMGTTAEARLHGARSTRLLLSGDLQGALRHTEQALDLFLRVGDLRNACAQRLDLGMAWFRLGDPAKAEPIVAHSLFEAERLGLAPTVAIGRVWLAAVLGALGRQDEGLALLEKSRAQLEDRELAVPLCWVYFQIGEMNLARAALAEAEVAARKATTLARSFSTVQAQINALLARVLLACDRPEEALQASTYAMSRLREDSYGNDRSLAVYLTHARTSAACGAHGQARVTLGLAHQRLLQTAARLDDPEVRHRYLFSVPEHRQILAWFERLHDDLA